jgi:hypothetical protein
MTTSHGLRVVLSVLGLTAVGLLTACGGSSGGPPVVVQVAVRPHGTSVVAGSQTQQFSAVTGLWA